MSEHKPAAPVEEVRPSGRERFGNLLQQGLQRGRDEALKGKLHFEHALGLGPKPNVIPPGEAFIHGDLRNVEIGWHPVPGLGSKWFTDSLGNIITGRIGKYPDPTQHWAVLVGEYVHELWMDEHLHIIYINEHLDRPKWHTFDVGKTRFSDEALRKASEMVIHAMRTKRPAYNLISNNCQDFAVAMLDAIQIGAHQQFATAFSVYQRATGAGDIQDLFVERPPEEHVEEDAQEPIGAGHLHRQNTVEVAQQVMEENTTKLDDHHEVFE